MPAEPMTDEQLEAWEATTSKWQPSSCGCDRCVEIQRVFAAVPALVAEVRRLRGAIAECGRAGCPTAAAISSAPPQAKPQEKS